MHDNKPYHRFTNATPEKEAIANKEISEKRDGESVALAFKESVNCRSTTQRKIDQSGDRSTERGSLRVLAEVLVLLPLYGPRINWIVGNPHGDGAARPYGCLSC